MKIATINEINRTNEKITLQCQLFLSKEEELSFSFGILAITQSKKSVEYFSIIEFDRKTEFYQWKQGFCMLPDNQKMEIEDDLWNIETIKSCLGIISKLILFSTNENKNDHLVAAEMEA